MNVASLQKVVLALAESQTVDSLLQIIVGALAEQCEVAWARVWLRGPGDICRTCDMKSSCPDQRFCLHLVASAGNPLGSDGPERSETNKWTRIDGNFRRIPLNAALEVGKVGGKGRANQRNSSVVGKNTGQSRRLADRGIRRPPKEHSGRPIPVLEGVRQFLLLASSALAQRNPNFAWAKWPLGDEREVKL